MFAIPFFLWKVRGEWYGLINELRVRRFCGTPSSSKVKVLFVNDFREN